MAVPDGGVLELTDSPEGGQHVLDCVLQSQVGVPGSHLLVQGTDVLCKLLTVHVHLLHIDLLPEGGLLVIDAALYHNDVIPQSLQKFDFLPALFELLEVRDVDLKETRRVHQFYHLFLHG